MPFYKIDNPSGLISHTEKWGKGYSAYHGTEPEKGYWGGFLAATPAPGARQLGPTETSLLGQYLQSRHVGNGIYDLPYNFFDRGTFFDESRGTRNFVSPLSESSVKSQLGISDTNDLTLGVKAGQGPILKSATLAAQKREQEQQKQSKLAALKQPLEETKTASQVPASRFPNTSTPIFATSSSSAPSPSSTRPSTTSSSSSAPPPTVMPPPNPNAPPWAVDFQPFRKAPDVEGASSYQSTIPKWQHQLLQNIAEAGINQYGKTEFENYEGPRIAERNPEQRFVQSELGKVYSTPNAAYDAAQRAAQAAMGQSAVDADVSNLLRESRTPLTDRLATYTNPYQRAVLDAVRSRAEENLRENVLPQIRSGFISRGSYYGGNRGELEARAGRDLQRELANQEAGILSQGYDKALHQANVDRQKQMEQASMLASINQTGIDSRAQQAGRMMQSAAQAERDKVDQLNALNNFGNQLQDIEQQKLNIQYQDFLAQQEFPWQKLARMNEMARGMPTGTFMSTRQYNYKPRDVPIPTSNASVLGGLGGVIAGMNMKARGGRVGYADGGVVEDYSSGASQSPRDMMSTIASHMHSGGRDLNPMGLLIARMFSGSENPKPGEGMREMLGALPKAVEAYTAAHGSNTANLFNSAKILDMVDTSRERERQHNIDAQNKAAQLDIDRLYKMGTLAENRAYHQEMMANKAEDREFKAAQTENKASRIDQRMLEKMNEAEKASAEAHRILNEMSSLLDQGLKTGPEEAQFYAKSDNSIGTYGRSIVRSFTGRSGKQLEMAQQFEVLSNALVVQLSSALRAFGEWKMVESSKPNLSLTVAANRSAINHFHNKLTAEDQKREYMFQKELEGIHPTRSAAMHAQEQKMQSPIIAPPANDVNETPQTNMNQPTASNSSLEEEKRQAIAHYQSLIQKKRIA